MEEPMVVRRRWKPLILTVMLAGGVLGEVFVYGRLGEQNQREKEMNDTRFTIDHVRRTTDKSYEDVTTAFVRQLGHFDPTVYQALEAGGDVNVVRTRIESMAGPSGFMLFGTQNHGQLLRLTGQKRKAVQYVVGNPLIALQMTQHDIRASLYAPLRVLIYEDESGKTWLEYDRPSSLFGQFGNDGIRPIATMLDRKLDALVTASLE
jgi:uncharacterized protein (DUF302 family)